MNLKKRLILVLLFLLPVININASEQNLYEMPGTQVMPLKNTETGGQYELYIKLPEKYFEEKEKHYPIIYFTDAVWHIEILSAATAYLMEEVILVGISWQKDIEQALIEEHGAHVSRFRDYSSKKSSNPKTQAKYKLGQANKHLSFIRNDVISHIEKNYRTEPDNRTYFGYSMGGEFGAYALLTQPDSFNNYILGSPSIKGEIDHLSKLFSSTATNDLNANVFISYGEQEKELGEHVQKFITLLKSKKDTGLLLQQAVVAGDHQRAFPMTGVHSITWLSELQNNKDKS